MMISKLFCSVKTLNHFSSTQILLHRRTGTSLISGFFNSNLRAKFVAVRLVTCCVVNETDARIYLLKCACFYFCGTLLLGAASLWLKSQHTRSSITCARLVRPVAHTSTPVWGRSSHLCPSLPAIPNDDKCATRSENIESYQDIYQATFEQFER